MRYEVRRDYGGKQKETRREYNARFGQHPGPQAYIPEAGEHIWEWFWTISKRRHHSEAGPQPITHAEIRAWSKLYAIEPYPDEVATLVAMDDAYLAETASEMEGIRERQMAKGAAPRAKPKYR